MLSTTPALACAVGRELGAVSRSAHRPATALTSSAPRAPIARTVRDAAVDDARLAGRRDTQPHGARQGCRVGNSINAQIARTWERYRPMLYLSANSGTGPQEYLVIARSAIQEYGVQVERAIDGSGQSISVPKTPAGRRFIEISPDVLEMIRHYADNHAVPNKYDLVFPATNGHWQCRRNWQRRGFNVACYEAGLVQEEVVRGVKRQKPKYRPYDLRHFFASILIEKKTNLKKIQVLMGHTSIETTLNVYGHLLEDNLDTPPEEKGILSGML